MAIGLAGHRQHKISQILQMINQAMNEGKVVEQEQLIASLGIDWGLSRRTVLEYLKTLEFANKIKRVDGEILTIEKYNAIQEIADMDPKDLKTELEGGDEHATTESRRINEPATTSATSSSDHSRIPEDKDPSDDQQSRNGIDDPESNAKSNS